MNMLIMEPGTGHGGSSAYLYSFLKYFDIVKFKPTVILNNFSEAYQIKKIQELGIEVVFLNNKYRPAERISSHLIYVSGKLAKFLGYSGFLYRFIKKDVPDVIKIVKLIKKKNAKLIMLNGEVNLNIAGVLAAKLAGVPCIVRKSGVGTLKGDKIRRILSSLVDVFIASSNAEYQWHIEKRFPFKRMVTVYEGADISHFYPASSKSKIRAEFGIKPEQKIVGSISRLDVGKGHSDFIKAASLVIKKQPDTIFLIVGDDVDFADGYMRRHLQEKVNKLGISDKVIFTGWRNDIFDILQEIDIFVHCPDTWLEGMGIATLEAQACGKPVIVTNNWGLAETTKNGYNGFVIPVGDFLALSEKIILLLNNKELRTKMGSNSRIHAENTFDMRKTVNKIERIMCEVLK